MSSGGQSCVTLVWRIENFSRLNHLAKGKTVPSPQMGLAENGLKEWRLYVYPRGLKSADFIDVEAVRYADETDVLNCEFSLLAADGTPHFAKKARQMYGPWEYTLMDFVRRNQVEERATEFLPRDTLTIQCRAWGQSVRPRGKETHVARTEILEGGSEGDSTCENFSVLQLPFPADRETTEYGPSTHLTNLTDVRIMPRGDHSRGVFH